jgi:hypothetical protein
LTDNSPIDAFVTYDGKRASDIAISRFAVRQLVASEVSVSVFVVRVDKVRSRLKLAPLLDKSNRFRNGSPRNRVSSRGEQFVVVLLCQFLTQR